MNIVNAYPSMQSVLVKEGSEKQWKVVKGVPKVFKELEDVLGLGKEVFDEQYVTTIVGIYNVKGELVVDCMNPRNSVINQKVYGTGDSQFDSCIEKIIDELVNLKVPVEDIYILQLGSKSTCRLKRKSSGEYTLVIE